MKLLNYNWIHLIMEDDKAISDFDNAIECEECGRKIVHVYTIENDNGTIKKCGSECTKGLISQGKAKKIQKKFLNDILSKQYKIKEELLYKMHMVERNKSPLKYETARHCRRNWATTNETKFSFFSIPAKEFDGIYYYCLPEAHVQDYNFLLKLGWKLEE